MGRPAARPIGSPRVVAARYSRQSARAGRRAALDRAGKTFGPTLGGVLHFDEVFEQVAQPFLLLDVVQACAS